MYETIGVSFQCIKGKAVTLPFLCFVWLLFLKRKTKTCYYLSFRICNVMQKEINLLCLI